MIERLFMQFMDRIKEFGLEYFGRWYGWYPGECVDNEDPQNQDRIRVKVPMVQLPEGSSTLPFAYPMAGPISPGEGKGSTFVPDVGDKVWVSFRNGNLSNPMYAPWGWFAQGEKPSEFETVQDRGWKTSSGHVVRFRDTGEDESILIRHKGGSEIEVQPSGSVSIVTQAGDSFLMDPEGSLSFEHRSGASLEMDGTSSSLQSSTGTLVDLSSANAVVESSAVVQLKSGLVQAQGQAVELGKGAIHPLVYADVLNTYIIALSIWLAGHVHPSPGAPPAAPPPPPVPPTWTSPITRTA